MTGIGKIRCVEDEIVGGGGCFLLDVRQFYSIGKIDGRLNMVNIDLERFIDVVHGGH